MVMRSILTVISLIWLLMSPIAEAKREPLPDHGIAAVGPKSVALTPKDIQRIRSWSEPYYDMAKLFSERYGSEFLNIVESRLDPNGTTNIIVAMGGAEHLGVLIEMGLRQRGLLDRVKMNYVDLSRDTIRTWRAVRTGDPMRVRVGLGPLPKGWELEVQAPHGTVEELAEKMHDLDLPDRRAIVLDTCCEGSAIEAVAAVMRYWRPAPAPGVSDLSYREPEVEGVMIHHNQTYRYQHTVPMHALSDKSVGEKPDTWRWAWMIDGGRVMDQVKYANERIFQRSDELRAKPNKALENYKATILGLHDGLESCAGSL